VRGGPARAAAVSSGEAFAAGGDNEDSEEARLSGMSSDVRRKLARMGRRVRRSLYYRDSIISKGLMKLKV